MNYMSSDSDYDSNYDTYTNSVYDYDNYQNNNYQKDNNLFFVK